MDIFTEIGVILAITLLAATFMRLLKQPLIVGYILTGLIVGPHVLNILKSPGIIEVLSKLGITALLFIVGLGLSPKLIKELGFVSLVIGISQIALTFAIGYFVSSLLGFSLAESLYVATALTFSSTIIILKFLSDKGDINKLYGRITIGILLIQDLVAIITLVVITSLSSVNSSSGIVFSVLLLLLKGSAVFVVLLVISVYVLPKFAAFIADSQEFLFVSAIAWGVGIGALYHKLGLSAEIGALIAGVSVSMTPYAREISSKMKPLRDFFIILFFILLGYQMVLEDWRALIVPAIVFSILVLIGKPLIVFVLMNLLGYGRRVGFFSGASLAQISEFSLVLVALGYGVGHVSREVLSLITLIGIVTIAGSAYLILYSENLYRLIGSHLSIFELRKVMWKKETSIVGYEAILFGYRRVGPQFAHAFAQAGYNFLIIDFNPHTIGRLEKAGLQCQYGDASDVDFLQELPMRSVKMIVSTIPDFETNVLLTRVVRGVNEDAVIVTVADTLYQTESLYSTGVTHVIMSHYVGAREAANMIINNKSDKEKYEKQRWSNLDYLEKLKVLSFEGHF